jgi:S-ribosylhomocysteine lyase
MIKIASFTVDHNRLKEGIYVSRVDHLGDETVTTLDLRFKLPNADDYLPPKVAHTLEHLLATYFRSDNNISKRVVYFGPMGCQTGMYLVLHGQYSSDDVLPLVINAMKFVSTFEGEIPGSNKIECGQYTFHDLKGAKKAATDYLFILDNIDDSRLNYPAL